MKNLFNTLSRRSPVFGRQFLGYLSHFINSISLKSLTTSALLMGCLFGSMQLQAAIINVPADQPTISAAVAVAVAGDEIVVAPGTYNENVVVNKSLIIRSSGGRGVTTINGSAGTLGTFLIQADGVTIGGPGQGFTINGYDNSDPGLEYAAIYIQGIRNNITIRGNDIVANGEAGLLSEFSSAVNNLTVNANIFSGKTYTGSEAGDCGFANQFTVANVPRQLANIPTGTDIIFTSNQITGTAGSSSTVGSCVSTGQGNTLVTIDANNATIIGNTFAGTTTRFGSSLRVRGTGANISCNTFDNTGLGLACVHIFFSATSIGALGTPNTLAGVASENVFINEGAYFTGATQIYRSSAQVAALPQTPIAANSTSVASVINTNTGLFYCSIQAAIDDANTLNGHTIVVGAGTYAENVSLSKSVTLRGPNHSLVPCVDTRLPEAIITGGLNIPNGTSLTIVVEGLHFQGVSSPMNYNGNVGTATLNATFRNNLVNGNSGQLAVFTGNATNHANLTIQSNCFSNMSSNAMQIGAFTGSMVTAQITGNTINGTVNSGINVDAITNSNINSNNISNTAQQGIQVAGAASNVNVNANVITNANTSLDANRGGVRIRGTNYAGAVNVLNNIISGSLNGVIVPTGENITGKTINVNDNNLSGNTFGVTNSGTGTLNATCNWYGTTDAATVATLISGSVTYSPFLTNGTDSAPGTMGFQPVAGSCSGCFGAPTVSFNISGSSVASINNNTADPSESATVAVCDGGTYTLANLVHSSGTSRYTVSVTPSGGGLLFNGSPAGNGDISAAQFTGAQGVYTVTLSNPALGGTVVQVITPYNDADNSGGFSAGDCAGDPVTITYTATAKPTFSFTGNGDTSIGDNAVNVSICSGGNLTLSAFASSSSTAKYYEVRTATPGLLYGVSPIGNGNQIISAGAASSYFGNTYGAYNNTTTAPGTITQVITPFEDVINIGQYDPGIDCAGTPVTLTITVNPTPAISFTAQVAGGTPQNGSSNGPTSVTLDFCAGQSFSYSNYVSIPGANVGVLNDLTGTGNVTYNGAPVSVPRPQIDFGVAGTPGFFAGTYGPYGLSSGASGQFVETFTPYYDSDMSGTYTSGDCLGTPITITYNVSALPAITCPSSFSVGTSSNGAGNCNGVANWTHPAIPAAGACNLTSLTMSINAGTPVAVTPGGSASQTLNVGMHTVTYVATFSGPNTRTCSFTITVVDDEPPAVICKPYTITFNGLDSMALTAADLVLSSSDNCGIASTTLQYTKIGCQSVGQTIPVVVTVTDVNGLTNTCTSNVTVGGLPCGWNSNSNSIGCTNNVTYAPGTGTWTNTASSCFYASPFNADDIAFIQRTLCGNGSITALVTSISGNALGWAGVTMRESNAVGAKKAQLTTNLSNFSRREFRTTTNGSAIPQQFPSLTRYWLRVVRVGNQFSMYVSPDGSVWYFVGAQNIVMSQCIQIGLVTTNYTPNSTVTSVFSNVSHTGSSTPLALPANNGPAQLAEFSTGVEVDFNVFPNPTNGELNLDLTQYFGRSVRIETYSLEGKLLQFIELDEVQNTLERLDLGRFENGMYLVKVKSSGLPEVTRRVVKQ